MMAVSYRRREEIVSTCRKTGSYVGEMDFNQLWETTMDYHNRTLIRIKMDDAEKADQAFQLLMGDKVPPRRKFIEDNARMAILDV